MNPYIGDRQPEPPDEYECPHCGAVFSYKVGLTAHIMRCPENDEFDPEVEID